MILEYSLIPTILLYQIWKRMPLLQLAGNLYTILMFNIKGIFFLRYLEGNIQKMKDKKIFRVKKFILDYSHYDNLDNETNIRDYPLFPTIYASMDDDAESFVE